jgi:hypothetical protein
MLLLLAAGQVWAQPVPLPHPRYPEGGHLQPQPAQPRHICNYCVSVANMLHLYNPLGASAQNFQRVPNHSACFSARGLLTKRFLSVHVDIVAAADGAATCKGFHCRKAVEHLSLQNSACAGWATASCTA